MRVASRREVQVAILLAIAAFVLATEIGRRYYVRSDWTRSGRYSLSQRTRTILSNLRDPVTLTSVIALAAAPQTPEEAVVARLAPDVEELLRVFARSSPKIRLKTVDAFRDPAQARTLLSRFQVRLPNVILVEGRGVRRVVGFTSLADLGTPRQPGSVPPVQSFRGEERLAAAILGVASPRRAVAYFTRGHGERGTRATGPAGLLVLDRLLRRAGFETRPFDTLAGGAVPADATVVIVAGPRTPFVPREARALRAYFDGGGALLVLLDPLFEGLAPKPTGLEGMLRGLGLRVSPGLVRDPSGAFPFVPDDTFIVRDFPAHAITRALSDLRLVIARARTVSGGLPLMRTSPRARRASNPSDPGGGKPDVFWLAATVERRGRLVLVGDSDLASNAQLESAGNRALLLRSVDWLARSEVRLQIPARPVVEARLTMNRTQLRTALWILFVVLPGGAATAGIIAFAARRRRA